MLPVPAPPGRPCLVAGNRPMWSVLPAGRGGVASGTLLAVTRPPSSPPAAPPRHRLAAVLVAALTATVMGTATARQTAPAPPPAPGPSAGMPRADRVEGGGLERKPPPEASIVWRRSRAVGKPYHGRLVRGVRLPAFGTHFVTVDPVTGTSPNPAWRRYGTDRLVRVLLKVAAAYAAAHPDAPRLVVGDLSRPRGGRFGREFGGDGHRSHQNGLDVDIFYPRRDGRERIPARVGQVDRRLAQDLVDRFVRAGARYVFVGPRTRLHGPSRVVMTLANHDDHLHVRIRPGPRR
jgi:Penicillin-insensitive murein endopeptidase